MVAEALATAPLTAKPSSGSDPILLSLFANRELHLQQSKAYLTISHTGFMSIAEVSCRLEELELAQRSGVDHCPARLELAD